MRRHLLTSTLLILLGNVLFAQNMGTISVVSEPESCWVRIDSVLVGKTPLNELDLEAGEHLVEVYPPQQGIWNLQERFFRPVIKAGEHTSLKVVFQPPVFINSIPYGAQLWSDTTRFGLTPLYIPFEENRGRLFKLLKEGYKPYEFILKENQSILARMERGKDYMDDESDPRLLGFVSKKHLKSKFTLLALTVATHWTSFYFKNKADDYHQEYLTSSDPQEIQEAWDKTQKYDTLSSITLGISYASLAGLIYMVIWK